MAESVGAAASGHPALNLTPDEKRVYGQLFKEADPDGFGAVSGDVAVKFFEKTKLAPDVLGQIWQIADTENRGFLTPAGFGVVLRLIGHAQAGRTPSPQLATAPAPLPRFDGQTASLAGPSVATAPLTQQTTGPPTSPSQAPGGPIRVPALSPEKVAEYSLLFEKSGAENGALSGLVAKQIFERARLPNEVLGRIWSLSDAHGRGSLDVTEFVIAMHMLASYKTGAMRGVPNTLPPGLYEAASRRVQARSGGPLRPGSSAGQSIMQPQFSGYGRASPVARQQIGTPLSAQSTGEGWVISSADKARFDSIFATIDTQGRGFLTGDQAVEFFGNARLPEEILAQIWDLADINSKGQLSRDEFAVAMYLIRQQRGTKDGRGQLPTTLPPALIPPSMRKQHFAPSQATAPAFGDATVTKPPSAVDDLFGLDVMGASQPPTAQIPQSTGGTDTGPFANPKNLPPVAASPQLPSSFRPFVPSSTFGQSIAPQSTGIQTSQSRSIPAVTAEDDLLGDGDPEVSSKLTNDTTELANLSNQVGNLSKQMTEVQHTRAQTEQELTQNNNQKRAFESRLAQLRSMYEKEVQEVKSLQEQLLKSKSDTKRLQQDAAMVEGTHADLQTQHQQIQAALQADQQENLALKEKIRQLNVENDQLKPQLEKVKSEARQHKGLVAINKKQLATNEAEQDRLKSELAANQTEIENAQKEAAESARLVEASHKEIENAKMETAELARRLEASHKQAETAKREAEETARHLQATHKELEQARSVPIPVHSPVVRSAENAVSPIPVARDIEPVTSPIPTARGIEPVASPALSTNSNPFFRRGTGDAVFSPPMGSAIASPEPQPDRSSAFDNIFGPSFGAASIAPTTSFGHDTQPSSREVSGFSDLPHVVEPPAPPSASQIKSSALPFRTPLERGDSVSSSVRVAPPASRLSPADTPRALTPDTSTASPGSQRQTTEDPFIAAAPHEEQAPVRQTLARGETQAMMEGIPGAFPGGESPRPVTPAHSLNPVAVAVGAGAATLAAGAGLAAAVGLKQPEKPADKSSSIPSDGSAPKINNFDDLFGGPAHQRTPSEQVADFDSAFASMDRGTATNGTSKVAGHEFPAIQEFDDGDDDSSDEDEVHRGFDDDFNSHAVTNSAGSTSKAAGKQPEVESAIPSYLQVRPQLETASSTASSLPGIDQQVSPPGYNESVPKDNPHHFPQEYKGLLPEREDPTSPVTAGGSSQPGPNPSGAPPSYGPEIGHAHSRRTSVEQSSAPPPTKLAPFDFDSAFSGMGAVPVEDDDDSDEEDEPGRAHPTDFDPTFDSPTRSMIAAPTTHTFSAHDAVTKPSVNGTGSSTGNFYDSGYDAFAPAASVQQSSGLTTSAEPTNTSHDWDALFAPLSSPSGPAHSTTTGEFRELAPSGNLPQHTSVHSTMDPVSSAAIPTITNNGPALPERDVVTQPIASSASAVPNDSLSPTSAATTGSGPTRPQPGRALSEGTEHDDPILKRLTAMGWSRTDSLAALERFDYNIDKAADYLTFRS